MATVEEYLSSLPADRRASITRVREIINANVPSGYEEGMLFGMIGWYVPFSRFSKTYNKQPLMFAGLASKKQYMALHLVPLYGDKKLDAAFRAGFKAAGKKLDMGKACVRFKTADALALDVIGETVRKVSVDSYIAWHDKVHGATKKKKPAAKKPAAKKSAAKRR